MKQIYFVRHGESEGNVDPTYKGVNPLSERGAQQAEILSERFKEIPLELIIVTSKKRSQQTADIINLKRNVPVEQNDLFLERVGDFEKTWTHKHLSAGEMTQEIRKKFVLPSWELNPLEENFSDLVARAKEALDFLEKIPQDKITIVTHGGFLKFLTSYIIFREKLTEDLAALFMGHTAASNTGVTMFKFKPEKNEWRLISWNDHGHLGPMHLSLGSARLLDKDGK